MSSSSSPHGAGFTALNERLSILGPAGPELVSKHLNAYFGQLIDAVNSHGGDVLKVRRRHHHHHHDDVVILISCRSMAAFRTLECA